MKISFDETTMDWHLLKTPSDWEALVKSQRQIHGNPILHNCGEEPMASDYPCIAIINGVQEGTWSSDSLKIVFLPQAEILEDEEGDDGED